MTEYALLSQVTVETKGSALAVDALLGDMTLTVDYAGDFDTDPNQFDEDYTPTRTRVLDLNGARLAYSSIVEGTNPDDPDVINLLDPVPADAETDDLVGVVEGNLIAEDWWAVCSMEDGDSIMVPITSEQRSSWPVGDYEPAVPVTLTDDLRTLLDAPGRTVSSRNSFRNTDTCTYDGVADNVVLPLSKVPISGSEQPFWRSTSLPVGGFALPPGSWRIELPNLIVDDSELMAEFDDGDLFWVNYAWDEALDDIQIPVEAPPTPPRVLAVDFEAGTDGDTLDNSNCPGLTSGVGVYVADPHSGLMAGSLADGYAGSGSGVISRVMSADGVDNVGLFAKFLSTTPGPGETFAHFIRCVSRIPGGSGFDTRSVVANFILDPDDVDFPGQLYIRTTVNGVTHDAFTISADTWYELRLSISGEWLLLDESLTTLDSGSVSEIPSSREFQTAAGSFTAPGRLVVDDYYYQLVPDVS